MTLSRTVVQSNIRRKKLRRFIIYERSDSRKANESHMVICCSYDTGTDRTAVIQFYRLSHRGQLRKLTGTRRGWRNLSHFEYDNRLPQQRNHGTCHPYSQILWCKGLSQYEKMYRCIGHHDTAGIHCPDRSESNIYKAYPGTSQNTRRHIGYGSKLRYNHNRWNHILFII